MALLVAKFTKSCLGGGIGRLSVLSVGPSSAHNCSAYKPLVQSHKAFIPHRLNYTTSDDIGIMASKGLAEKVKSVKLSSGYDMPMVGLGCYFGAEVRVQSS